MPRLLFRLPRRPLFLTALVVLGASVFVAPGSLGQQGTLGQQPEPDKTVLAKKEKTLTTMFKEELAKAKTDPQASRDLADLLLREAKLTTEDPALRYIALIYARDLAAQAGDTAVALAAIEELAKSFTVDTLAMKTAMLSLAAQKATSKEDSAAIAEQALQLVDEALGNDNYQVAQELIKAAEDAATKSKMLQLMARVEKASAEVDQGKKEFSRMSKFVDILAKNADDVAANREMGIYFCLVKGNWDKGLPMLVKGNDKDYLALARRDLANPKETLEQLDIGDEYYNLAQSEKALTHRNLLKRAYYWYVKCLPNLAGGLNKLRVEKRVDQIATLNPTASTPVAFSSAKIDTMLKQFERAHVQGIQVLAISHDSKYVVSGGIQESTVRLWDTKTGQQLRQMTGHKDEIWGVAFSPDDKMIASASTDKTMHTWETASGNPVRTFIGHTDWVRGVYFFQDKKRILTASDDYTLRTWDLSNGNELKRMSGHTNFINGLSVSRDGRRAVTGSVDQTVRVWDLDKAEEMGRYFHNNEVWAVAISPDGKRAVSASTDNVVKMFDLDKKQEIRQLTHPTRVWSIAFSPSGKHVVTGTGGPVTMMPKEAIEGGWPQQGNNDASLYFWETDSGKAVRRLGGHTGNVRALAYSSDGRFVVSGGDDNTMRLWGEKAK
jgi:WD40 repeat protein